MSNIIIREATDKDINFITSSWLKSYKESDFSKQIHPHVFFKKHEEHIKKKFKDSKIFILCDKLEPSSILAYICYEDFSEFNVLHFMYVKRPFRKFGLANILYETYLKDKDLIYTHKTYIVQELYSKHKNDRTHFIHKAIYNPYLFF